MSVSAGLGKFKVARKSLFDQWEETRSQWTDENSRQFEEQVISPLFARLRQMEQTLTQLDVVLHKVRAIASDVMQDPLQPVINEDSLVSGKLNLPPSDSGRPMDGGSDSTPDFLEIQRVGLRAILDLSRDAVSAAQAEVQQRFDRACASAEQTLQIRLADIEKRTQTELETIERGRSDVAPSIQAKYEAATATLAKKSRAAIEHLATSLQDRESEVQTQLQNQLLMADTVAQANCQRVRQERVNTEKQLAAEAKALDAIQANSLQLMDRYGVKPPPAPAPDESKATTPDAPADYEQVVGVVKQHLESLEHVRDHRVFTPPRLNVLLPLFCLVVVGGLGSLNLFGIQGAPSFSTTGPISLIVTVAASVAIAWTVRQRDRAQILAIYEPLFRTLVTARRSLEQRATQKRERLQQMENRSTEILRDNPEKKKVQRLFDAKLLDYQRQAAGSRANIEEVQRQQQAELDLRRNTALQNIDAEQAKRIDAIRQKFDSEAGELRKAHDQSVAEARAVYEVERATLAQAWETARQGLQRFLTASDDLNIPTGSQWEDRTRAPESPADELDALISFGHWNIDLSQLAADLADVAGLVTNRPPNDTTPAALGLNHHCSLLMQTERAGRQQAVDTLRVIMLRLLTTLRPGRVRFTIVDPVGLGESFAGFMHLVDYQEALVGGRIWTDAEQIESRLTELTSHMENVIQKYLRNEFPTIDAYNRQAGPLAEPYRFLIVADFPANFSDGAVRRISSIINSGARCGVYTLIMHDTRRGLPTNLPLEDLAGESLQLVHDGEKFVARDGLLRHFPLVLDVPPPEDELTRIMHEVGRGAKDAFRVEVPFDAIVPVASDRWTRDAATDLSIAIGLAGAVRFQQFTLGRGLAQHALMAGKTGSGKSTLMHVIITNLALSYPPEALELYLVDFKKGVEFKTYVTHNLPHARAIAIESDREFGVSVLQRLDAEMTRRGDLFRAAGVQDLPSYRTASSQMLPRTLLIVDEFQVFFSEDDKLAQEASVLLDRLVRQGRAFGIHLLLGSQTLAGSSGLARSTMGQMAVRIALQCSEADSQLILDDTNGAARLLSRPGEAIYNDAGGLVAGNSNFQVAWLSDERHSALLSEIQAMADTRHWQGEPAIVFEGNSLADIRQNRLAVKLIESPRWPTTPTSPQIWLGEPVAIKAPTGLTFRRQSGANLLAVGQRDDVAHSMLAASLLCLASQHPPQSAQFVVLGGEADEHPMSGGLRDVTAALPHSIRWPEWREIPGVIAELAAEVQRRIEQGSPPGPSIYLIVYGLQRYRMLRRREDSFSFSSSETEAAPPTDRQFAELLREGPSVGLHVLVWSDTLATLERTLDRQSMRKFDSRVLFQMSASDSSNLIDSPEANRLGLHSEVFFSEERGLLEKFRPYGPLAADWLQHVKTCMDRKTA